jgi:hypothetical protein
MQKRGKNNDRNKSPGHKKHKNGHEEGCRARTQGQHSSFKQKNKNKAAT